MNKIQKAADIILRARKNNEKVDVNAIASFLNISALKIEEEIAKRINKANKTTPKQENRSGIEIIYHDFIEDPVDFMSWDREEFDDVIKPFCPYCGTFFDDEGDGGLMVEYRTYQQYKIQSFEHDNNNRSIIIDQYGYGDSWNDDDFKSMTCLSCYGVMPDYLTEIHDRTDGFHPNHPNNDEARVIMHAILHSNGARLPHNEHYERIIRKLKREREARNNSR